MAHFSLLSFALCRQNIQGLILHQGYDPEKLHAI